MRITKKILTMHRVWLLGAGVSGALCLGACQPTPTVLTLTPAAVNAMKADTMVSVKGQVMEIFGNKFIVQDTTGRALVDTGPQGDDTALVKKGETVNAQGRFDHGVIHAELLTYADGRNIVVGPPGPPHGPGPHGPRRSRDPQDDRPIPPSPDAGPGHPPQDDAQPQP